MLCFLLSDKSDFLRQSVAATLARARDPKVVPTVFHALEKEVSPRVFSELHFCLVALSGKKIVLFPGAERRASDRKRLVQRWAKALSLSVRDAKASKK